MKLNPCFRCVLCTAAVCMTMLCSASAYATLTAESAAAYQGVIDDLAGQYGSARTAGSGSPVEGMYLGLACARLIDFDNDGVPELYCAYGVPSDNRVHQVLYTYDNGLVRLEIPEAVSNFGTDVSPSTRIFTGLGKAYLVDGQEIMNCNEVRYLTKRGNEMVTALTYVDGMRNDLFVRKVNGEDMTLDGLTRALNTFTLNMTVTEYSFLQNGDGEDPTATIKATLDEIASSTVIYAEPATAHLLIQDNSSGTMKEGRIDVAAYAIDGNLYLKLRDLAAVLNGTPRQFAVGWDGVSSSIRINTGRGYVRAGGELGPAPTARAAAERAASTIIVDGSAKTPTTYVITQSHYYRLRDLAEILGLEVSWDANTKTAILTHRV